MYTLTGSGFGVFRTMIPPIDLEIWSLHSLCYLNLDKTACLPRNLIQTSECTCDHGFFERLNSRTSIWMTGSIAKQKIAKGIS